MNDDEDKLDMDEIDLPDIRIVYSGDAAENITLTVAKEEMKKLPVYYRNYVPKFRTIACELRFRYQQDIIATRSSEGSVAKFNNDEKRSVLQANVRYVLYN